METTNEERNWAILAHLGGPIGNLLTGNLLGFLIPLVIWLIKRGESAFVDDQAKEAINFQITIFLMMIGLIVFAILTLGLGLLVAIPAWFVIWMLTVILGIYAAMRANAGERYRYPFALRLLS